jgi:hypothetical protein
VSDAWTPLLPREPIRFPTDFLWGTGSSAFQAEGGDVPNDWVDLARSGDVPPNPGNGFLERYAEDFRLLAELGFRHYRLSVEWSRVEPERGRFAEQAFDHYRAVCDAASEAGLTPPSCATPSARWTRWRRTRATGTPRTSPWSTSSAPTWWASFLRRSRTVTSPSP